MAISIALDRPHGLASVFSFFSGVLKFFCDLMKCFAETSPLSTICRSTAARAAPRSRIRRTLPGNLTDRVALHQALAGFPIVALPARRREFGSACHFHPCQSRL